jgi:Effector-associated domain 11
MTTQLEKTRALIREAKLDAAFHQILKLTANTPQETQFVQLNSQWSEIHALHLNGQMAFDEYFAERNRITMAFLTRIDDIEAESEAVSKPKTVSIVGEMELDIVSKALIDFHDGVIDLPTNPEARAVYAHYWALLTKKNIQIGRK